MVGLYQTKKTMNLIPGATTNTEQKAKSYWSKPDGKVGTIAGIGILGVIGYYLLPILTTIIWNTLNFGIALIVGVLAFLFFTNKKLWLSVGYFYKIFFNKLTGIVIQLNPFIIIQDNIDDIQKEREKLYNKSIEVDAQKESLNMKIQEKERSKRKQMDIAEAARQKGKDYAMELANATRQIQRDDAFIKQLLPIRDNLTRIGDYLTAVHKNSKFMVEDMKNDLESKKDLYNSVTKGNNALQSALNIFKGNPDKKEMLEQSMDFLRDDISNKLASMKKALVYSGDFMKSIDLENASYQAEGLRMLDEYKADTFMHNNTSEQPTLVKVQNKAINSNYSDLLQ